jgi:hypothetical protein
MQYLGIAVFLLAVTGIGAFVQRWLRGGEEPDGVRSEPVEGACREPVEGLGWSLLLGAAVVGLVLHLPLAIDGRITHLSFALVAAFGLAAWGWIGIGWWRGARQIRLRNWMSDLPVVAKIAVGIALLPAVVHAASTELSGYDARTIYGLKSRILYRTGTVRSEDFLDIDRLNFNPGYPLLLPLLETQMHWARGTDEGPGMKFLFLGFGLALVSIYARHVRRFEGPGFTATTAALLLMTPIIVCCFEGAGLSGSADLPLAALLFGGVLELSRWLQRPTWRAAASAGLLLGAAALTKMEGVIWVAGCGGTLAVVLLLRRKELRERLVTALPAIGLIGLAVVLGRAVHRGMPDSPYYPSYLAAIDWQWLKQLGDRPRTVMIYVGQELVRLRSWNLIWPAVLAAVLVLKRGKVPPEVRFWRLTALAIAAVYFGILVLTPLHLYYQLFTSTTRLLLHIYPLAVLIMSEQLAASGWSRQFAEIFDLETETDPAAAVVLPMTKKQRRKQARAA